LNEQHRSDPCPTRGSHIIWPHGVEDRAGPALRRRAVAGRRCRVHGRVRVSVGGQSAVDRALKTPIEPNARAGQIVLPPGNAATLSPDRVPGRSGGDLFGQAPLPPVRAAGHGQSAFEHPRRQMSGGSTGRRSMHRARSAARPRVIMATGWDPADVSPAVASHDTLGPSQREGRFAR